MKKNNPSRQVTNIYFNSSNHSSKSRKPCRSHGNGGNRRRYNNGNRHGNQRSSERVAVVSLIATAAVSIVKILKQKNVLDYLTTNLTTHH